MFCHNCGKSLANPEAKYCLHCGQGRFHVMCTFRMFFCLLFSSSILYLQYGYRLIDGLAMFTFCSLDAHAQFFLWSKQLELTGWYIGTLHKTK